MFKSNTHGLNGLKQKLLQIITFASIGVLLALSLMTFKQGQVQGAPSTTLNFQARLLNSSGSLVPDGNYHVEFKLYNVNTGGTALWTETRTTGNLVTVKNGFLSVNLGSVTAFPGTIEWSEEHWLTMNIGGSAGTAAWDGEMTPRIKLTAVPYAFQSEELAKTEGDGDRGVLAFDTLTANRSILLPDASGTICLEGSVDCGFLTGSASDYIQNGTAQQTNANFNIAASTGVAATIEGAAGQNIFVLNQNGGTAALTINSVGDATLAGDLAVDGGDITSTGALNITPGGAMTLGSTTQTATLQGSITSITSTGSGNDITLTSADQIILNPLATRGVDVNGVMAVGNNQTAHSQYALRVGHSYDSSGGACGFFGCFGIDAKVTLDNPTSPDIATGIASQILVVNNTTLTSAYGLNIWSADVEAGSSITNNYGIRVGVQSGGDTDYGIHVSGADDYGIYLDYGAALGASTPNHGLYVKNADTYAIHVDDGATRLDGTLEVGTLGASDTDSVLCRNAAGQLAACNSTFATSANAFMQGGNSFGTLTNDTAILGTNDANSLAFVTNGATGLTLDTAGDATFANDLYFAAEAAHTIKIDDSTTAATAGADLSILGANGNGAVGGAITIQGGTVNSGNFAGGNVSITGGTGTGLTSGGDVYIKGGNNSLYGGSVIIGGGTGATDGSVVIGNTNISATPVSYLLRATAGSGTDIAGADFRLAGGPATGSASGGSILFQTSDAGASGTSLQGLTTKATLLASGNFGIGDTTPAALLTVGASDAFQVNASGNITTSGIAAIQGGTATLGAASGTAGSLVLYDGGSGGTENTVTFNTGTQTGNYIIDLPDNLTQNDEICLLNAANCNPTNPTFQEVYGNDTDGGNVIVNLDSTDGSILFRDNSTPLGGTLFGVQDSTGATDYLSVAAAGLTTSGDLAVNGGDITSTGALNITPGGALTVGATGQTATLQGSTTTITSTGAGNDITLTSADQIVLNASTGGTDINGVAAIGNNANVNSVQALNVGQNYNSVGCGFGCYGISSAATGTNVTSGFIAGAYFNSGTTDASFTLPTAYGAFVGSNTKGAGSTITNNFGLRIDPQSAGTNNIGVNIGNTSTGTNNVNLLIGTTQAGLSLPTIPSGDYSIYNQSAYQNYFAGALGIGDSTPDAQFTVGATSQFQVSSTGNVSTSGTLTLSALDCSTGFDNGGVLTTNGSGQLVCDDDNDTTANAFLQGGNAFGATAVLGTTDANDLEFRTGVGASNTRLTVSAAGATTVHGSLTAESGLTVTGTTSLNAGTAAGTVSIGNNTGNTSIFINSGTGSINIGTGTQTKTINFANGGGNQTIHIGSTAGSSQTNINAGTNGINLIASGASDTGVTVQNSTDSINSLRILTSSSDVLFRADTANNRIYVGDADTDPTVFITDRVATASLPSATTALNGGIIYDSTSDKFKIYEGGQIKEICNMTDLGCGAGASVTLQDVYDSSSPATIAVDSTNPLIIKSAAADNSTSFFQLQDANGQTLFVADTTNQRVAVGPAATPGNGVLTVGSNTTAASGGIYFGTDTNLYRSAANSLRTNDAFTVDGLLTGSAGATVSGAAISLNENSNFNTLINSGTSTGDVTIGNNGASVDVSINSGGTIGIGTGAQARTVNIANGAAAQTLTLGSTNTTSSTLIQGGTGEVTLTANGSTNTGTLVNTSNDSTNAFRIQDSGSEVLFRADSTNNRVYVGNATASTGADTTLLVVDSASTTNLPTGVNGGIVYDSTVHKFKVYENGSWKTLCNTVDAGCGASGASQDLQEAYDNSTTPATIETSSSTKNVVIKSGASADSTGVFQIQDSGSDTLFAADTTNNRLYVGNATGTAIGDYTLLVVDRAQDTDYLTSGVNGAIIYDDEADKFKVYENGLWKTLCNTTDLGCGSAGVSQSLQDAYNNSSTPALITTTSATKNFVFRSGIGFDSATMFQIQDASSSTLFVADTANQRVAIGDGVSPANGVLTVGSNTTAAAGGIYFGTDTNLYRFASGSLRTDGSLQLGEGADRTFDVQGRSTNAAGNSLTISAGDAGTGGSAFGGGTLTLQGGDAAGTGNANGGNIMLTGGAGTGTGAKGLVVIGTPTFTTTLDDANCFTSGALVASSCTISDSSVSSSSAIVVGFSVDSQTASLPDPVNTTAGRIIYITGANSSSDFTLSVNGGGQGNEIAMKANTSATMIWNGNDWTAAGASSSTTLQAAYNNTLTSAGGAEIVLNNTASSNGLTVRNNASNPITGGLFEIQSSIGTNLFSVNNRGTELAANGGSETDDTWSSNWVVVGGGSVARTTTSGEYVTGTAGAEATTTTTADTGIKNNLTGNPANVVDAEYQVSFAAKSSINAIPIEVIYSRDGGTTETACVNYEDGSSTSQTLSDSEWVKVTCTIVIDSTTAATDPDLIIRKTSSGSAPQIWIDNLSFMRNDTSTEPSNVQVGGGIDGGPITLFTLDRSSAPPVEDGNETYLGSMYYDTVSGRIQCYEADGWGACGSAPNNYVNLVPEFPGAVLNGSDVGTMSADFCSNSGTLSVNSSLCASGQALNFYQWTSPQATEQEYSIYVTYQLPGVFKNFDSNSSVELTARTDSTTNGSVTYQMYRSEGGSLVECGSETTVTTSANIWQTVPHNGNEADFASCGFSETSANTNVVFKINVKAKSNANVYVGTLSFTTIGQ